MNDPLEVHRAFYDAIESGDVDLMATLWAAADGTSCVHPGATPVRGTAAILRTWTMLMANVGYIQFFLTDINLLMLPVDQERPRTAVITCTENILSDVGTAFADSFSGGRAVATSILVSDGRTWKIWARHASPVFEPSNTEGDGQ